MNVGLVQSGILQICLILLLLEIRGILEAIMFKIMPADKIGENIE